MTYAQFQQPAPGNYQYRPYASAHTRARIVTVLLMVGAAISLITIPSHVLDMYVQPLTEEQEITDNPGGFLSLALTAVLGLAGFAVYVATVIVFLMWLYRSSNNLRAFGEPQQTSAGWAVGSFFVPIMNLFVPYRAVKEIWKKSDPAAANSLLYTPSPPGFFPAWWGFWLAANFASNIYFRMTWREAPIESTEVVGILSEILSIAAACFAVQVVREIDRRQEARAKDAHQIFAPPPAPPVFEKPQPPLPATEGRPASPAGETSRIEEPAQTTGLQGPTESKNSD